MKRKSNGVLILGIILIILGLFIVLDRFLDFYFYEDWSILPGIAALLGIFLLIRGFRSPAKGGVFAGTVLLILGVFYFLRCNYLLPILYWNSSFPVIILAIGIGFLVLFIVKPKDWGPLIPAVILIFIGGALFIEEWGIWYIDLWDIIRDYWPILLILIGIKIVLDAMKRKKPDES